MKNCYVIICSLYGDKANERIKQIKDNIITPHMLINILNTGYRESLEVISRVSNIGKNDKVIVNFPFLLMYNEDSLIIHLYRRITTL